MQSQPKFNKISHIAIKELVKTWGAGVKPLAGGTAPPPLLPLPNVLTNSTKAINEYLMVATVPSIGKKVGV
jgi:hypothetical protein